MTKKIYRRRTNKKRRSIKGRRTRKRRSRTRKRRSRTRKRRSRTRKRGGGGNYLEMAKKLKGMSVQKIQQLLNFLLDEKLSEDDDKKISDMINFDYIDYFNPN